MQNVLSFSTNGEKRIAFGSFVVNQTSGGDIDSYELSHSALTSAGTLGSPVIDAKNGLVIGVHLGGQWSSERNKGNSGVAWTKVVENVDFNAILE
jgi:V8-like Glu-specific endopeptidase